jgi:putative tryptophan/tyrosine transport system substrate-binding protein
VTSLARPGGNLTGINFFAAELAAKRLELLRELVPSATRVAVLVNPANAENTEATLRDVEAAARTMRLQIRVINASTRREIDAAFASFVHERPDALFVGSGPCSVGGGRNWHSWQDATAFPRYMPADKLPKLAGL